MRSQDNALSPANEVTGVAESLSAAFKNAREGSSFIRIAERNNSSDTVLDGGRELAGSLVSDLGPLTTHDRWTDVSQHYFSTRIQGPLTYSPK